jgi:hypothetical protein
MMRTIELGPAAWSDYFATVTIEDNGSPTRVHAVSSAPSAGPGAAIARPLRGISFDSGRHLIELTVGGPAADRPAIRYFVGEPYRIVAIEVDGLRGIVILDAEGLRTVVWLGTPAPVPLRTNVGDEMTAAEPTTTLTARGPHYTALLETIERQDVAKLHPKDRERLLEAADALLFGESENRRLLRSAEDLIESLKTSERWSAETCDQLREHLYGCDAAHPS